MSRCSLIFLILFLSSLLLALNRANKAGLITAWPLSSRWSLMASSSLLRTGCLVCFLSKRKQKTANLPTIPCSFSTKRKNFHRSCRIYWRKKTLKILHAGSWNSMPALITNWNHERKCHCTTRLFVGYKRTSYRAILKSQKNNYSSTSWGLTQSFAYHFD